MIFRIILVEQFLSGSHKTYPFPFAFKCGISNFCFVLKLSVLIGAEKILLKWLPYVAILMTLHKVATYGNRINKTSLTSLHVQVILIVLLCRFPNRCSSLYSKLLPIYIGTFPLFHLRTCPQICILLIFLIRD